MLILLVLNASRLSAVEQTTVLVVRPAAFNDSLQAWKQYREKQGFRILELTPEKTAEATLTQIQRTLAQTTSPEIRATHFKSEAGLLPSIRSVSKPYIVLMADSLDYSDAVNRNHRDDRIPTFYIDSEVVKNFDSEPTIASDLPYADWDRDGQLDAYVGRVPATSPEELQRYLQRVVALDAAPKSARWQREIDVTAGVGDFGIVADTLIEGVTRQLLTQDLPDCYRLSMTQASPKSIYCPSPFHFRDSVVQRLNDGGLFWVYLGHGHIHSLDFIRFGQQPAPILDRDSLSSLSIAEGSPIAILLACYLAAYDANEACFAEHMLMRTNGPIAIVGGSRVTMPYAMGVLGSEFIHACFVERYERIGELFHEAKAHATSLVESRVRSEADRSRRSLMDSMAQALSPDGHSLDAERAEHNYIFNLLGDPLIKIEHPQSIAASIPSEAYSGTTISIVGEAPFAGNLRVELAYRRNRVPDRVKQIKSNAAVGLQSDQQQMLYQAANELTLADIERSTPLGTFELSLPIPHDCHGTYQVNVILENPTAWAATTQAIQVKVR